MPGKLPKFDYVVFIGRFQPVHHGHIHTIKIALASAKKIIIVIGSSNSAPSLRSPWNADQRIKMLKKCFDASERSRLIFLKMRDRLYAEEIWNQNVTQEIFNITGDKVTVGLIGHSKDSSSYYLKNFPQWPFIETGNFNDIHSTDFRKSYFGFTVPKYELIHPNILPILKQFQKTSVYLNLKQEFLFVEKIKRDLQEESFSVANCVITCGNYILLITRKGHPGKGLVALPGGRLETQEPPSQGALRELYEETDIQIPTQKLLSCFVKQGYFDDPDRSPIARSYAYVFFYHLGFSVCPKVTAQSDALHAQWHLLDDIWKIEQCFFADHYQIIQTMLGRINRREETRITYTNSQ